MKAQLEKNLLQDQKAALDKAYEKIVFDMREALRKSKGDKYGEISLQDLSKIHEEAWLQVGKERGKIAEQVVKDNAAKVQSIMNKGCVLSL